MIHLGIIIDKQCLEGLQNEAYTLKMIWVCGYSQKWTEHGIIGQVDLGASGSDPSHSCLPPFSHVMKNGVNDGRTYTDGELIQDHQLMTIDSLEGICRFYYYAQMWGEHTTRPKEWSNET